jgi:hypothetical protein
MRAPDDKKVAGPVERLCQKAGRQPKTGAYGRRHRDHYDKQIRQLLCRELERHGDVSDADWHALAQYFIGEFDRKPEEGRPTDFFLQYGREVPALITRQIRREERCSYKEAVAQAIVVLGIDDPDGWKAKALLKRVTR